MFLLYTFKQIVGPPEKNRHIWRSVNLSKIKNVLYVYNDIWWILYNKNEYLHYTVLVFIQPLDTEEHAKHT